MDAILANTYSSQSEIFEYPACEMTITEEADYDLFATVCGICLSNMETHVCGFIRVGGPDSTYSTATQIGANFSRCAAGTGQGQGGPVPVMAPTTHLNVGDKVFLVAEVSYGIGTRMVMGGQTFTMLKARKVNS